MPPLFRGSRFLGSSGSICGSIMWLRGFLTTYLKRKGNHLRLPKRKIKEICVIHGNSFIFRMTCHTILRPYPETPDPAQMKDPGSPLGTDEEIRYILTLRRFFKRVGNLPIAESKD